MGWRRIRGSPLVVGAGPLGDESVSEREQHGAQLPALLGIQRGEQRFLGVLLRARRTGEVPFASGGERDQVTATVVGVALPGDESIGLKWIEQRDQNARVYVHRLHELLLRHPTVIVQEPENLELSRLQVVRGMRGTQAAHRLLPE